MADILQMSLWYVYFLKWKYLYISDLGSSIVIYCLIVFYGTFDESGDWLSTGQDYYNLVAVILSVSIEDALVCFVNNS